MFAGYKKKKLPISTICLTSIQHSKTRLGRSHKRHYACLTSSCDAPSPVGSPALAGVSRSGMARPGRRGDSGPADSPAEAPTAVAAALERAEDEVAGRIAAP